MLRRAKAEQPGEADPALDELREADAEYHRLCIDLQEPMVPEDELPLDELADAVGRLGRALDILRQRR